VVNEPIDHLRVNGHRFLVNGGHRRVLAQARIAWRMGSVRSKPTEKPLASIAAHH
jgi:hypothetical protein